MGDLNPNQSYLVTIQWLMMKKSFYIVFTYQIKELESRIRIINNIYFAK